MILESIGYATSEPRKMMRVCFSRPSRISVLVITLTWSFAQADEGQILLLAESNDIGSGLKVGSVSTPVPIEFEVQSAWTKRLKVLETPPMPGLPPVAGTIHLTMRLVKDPGLPDPLPPEPPARIDDPGLRAAVEEFRQSNLRTELMLVSGMVYDDERTFLQIYPNGVAAGKVSAWSNVNFNHFGGFHSFRLAQADGSFTEYSFLMALTNMDTEAVRRCSSFYGSGTAPTVLPAIPTRASVGPAFVVTEGQAHSGVVAILERLHALYEDNGKSLEAAHLARQAENARKRAEYLANPPRPEDVTISFWKRDRPAPAALEKFQSRPDQ